MLPERAAAFSARTTNTRALVFPKDSRAPSPCRRGLSSSLAEATVSARDIHTRETITGRRRCARRALTATLEIDWTLNLPAALLPWKMRRRNIAREKKNRKGEKGHAWHQSESRDRFPCLFPSNHPESQIRDGREIRKYVSARRFSDVTPPTNARPVITGIQGQGVALIILQRRCQVYCCVLPSPHAAWPKSLHSCNDIFAKTISFSLTIVPNYITSYLRFLKFKIYCSTKNTYSLCVQWFFYYFRVFHCIIFSF